MAPVVCLRPQYSLTALAMLCLSLGKHGHVSTVRGWSATRGEVAVAEGTEEGRGHASAGYGGVFQARAPQMHKFMQIVFRVTGAIDI